MMEESKGGVEEIQLFTGKTLEECIAEFPAADYGEPILRHLRRLPVPIEWGALPLDGMSVSDAENLLGLSNGKIKRYEDAGLINLPKDVLTKRCVVNYVHLGVIYGLALEQERVGRTLSNHPVLTALKSYVKGSKDPEDIFTPRVIETVKTNLYRLINEGRMNPANNKNYATFFKKYGKKKSEG